MSDTCCDTRAVRVSMPPGQPLPSHPAHPVKRRRSTAANEESAHRGNFFSSLFTLVNVILGTGMLTLPYSFSKAGLVPGFLIMVVYGALLYSSAYVVVCVSDRTGSQSFEAIVHRLLGERWGIVTSVMVAVYAFFMSTSCLIIVADMAAPVAKYVAPDAHHGIEGFAVTREAHIIIGAVLALPAMLMKDFTALRFTSLLAFCCLVLVVCVVISYYAQHGVVHDSDTNATDASVAVAQADGNVRLWPADYQLIYAIPNVALSLTCQLQVAAIYPEMEDEKRSPGYFSKVLITAYALVVTIYIPITIFGYMTFPYKTPPNIMDGAYPASDPLIMLSRICLMLTAVCTMPLNHHPCRSALRDLWDQYRRRRAGAEGQALVAETGAGVSPRSGRASPTCARSRIESVRSAATGLTGTEFSSRVHVVPPRDAFFFIEVFLAWLVMIGIASVVPNLSILCAIINFTAGVLIMFIFPGIFLHCVDTLPYPFLPKASSSLRALGKAYIVWGVLSGIIAFISFIGGTFIDKD